MVEEDEGGEGVRGLAAWKGKPRSKGKKRWDDRSRSVQRTPG